MPDVPAEAPAVGQHSLARPLLVAPIAPGGHLRSLPAASRLVHERHAARVEALADAVRLGKVAGPARLVPLADEGLDLVDWRRVRPGLAAVTFAAARCSSSTAARLGSAALSLPLRAGLRAISSVSLSVCPSIHPAVHPSVSPSILPSAQSAHPPNPSIHPICPSIQPSIRVSHKNDQTNADTTSPEAPKP